MGISKVQIPEVTPFPSVCIPLRDCQWHCSPRAGHTHIYVCAFFLLQLNYFSRKAHTQYHLLPRTTIMPFVPLRFSPVILSQNVFPQYWRLKVYFSPALKKPAGLSGGLESRLKRTISDLMNRICLLRPQPWGLTQLRMDQLQHQKSLRIRQQAHQSDNDGRSNSKSYSFVQNV